MPPYDSLDLALVDLDRIVDTARREKSRLGIFPAMYREVTRSIRTAVRDGGLFDDDARMERLACRFCGRYVDAHDGFLAGEEVPRAWRVAFEAAQSKRRHMIVQHLMLGMNAHINLDLGISAADTAGEGIDDLYSDFVRVNEILFAMVDRLQGALDVVSPRMALLDRAGGTRDEAVMRLSIRQARSLAWPFALRLAAAPVDARSAEIARRDADTAWLGKRIVGRWSPVGIVGRVVSSSEVTDVDEVIAALGRITVDPSEIDRDVAEPPATESTSLRGALRRPRRG